MSKFTQFWENLCLAFSEAWCWLHCWGCHKQLPPSVGELAKTQLGPWKSFPITIPGASTRSNSTRCFFCVVFSDKWAKSIIKLGRPQGQAWGALMGTVSTISLLPRNEGNSWAYLREAIWEREVSLSTQDTAELLQDASGDKFNITGRKVVICSMRL